jgi:hypothetical protein
MGGGEDQHDRGMGSESSEIIFFCHVRRDCGSHWNGNARCESGLLLPTLRVRAMALAAVSSGAEESTTEVTRNLGGQMLPNIKLFFGNIHLFLLGSDS